MKKPTAMQEPKSRDKGAADISRDLGAGRRWGGARTVDRYSRSRAGDFAGATAEQEGATIQVEVGLVEIRKTTVVTTDGMPATEAEANRPADNGGAASRSPEPAVAGMETAESVGALREPPETEFAAKFAYLGDVRTSGRRNWRRRYGEPRWQRSSRR